MKKISLIVMLSFFACEGKEVEKIIDRHPNGEKKVVAVYSGQGLNEKIIKRFTFNRDGKIELFENKINGTIDYYFKGRLVKRKQKHLEKNIFTLIREDTIKSRIHLEEWVGFPNNSDSVIARYILMGSPSIKIVGTFVQGNWVSEGSYSLSNPNLDLNKMLKNYSISFDGNYILEFGKRVSNNRRHAKKYKILRLYPPKGNLFKAGYMDLEYVEVDYKNDAIIGKKYSEYLVIKDPFNISFSPGSDLKKDEHHGVKRSQMLWD